MEIQCLCPHSKSRKLQIQYYSITTLFECNSKKNYSVKLKLHTVLQKTIDNILQDQTLSLIADHTFTYKSKRQISRQYDTLNWPLFNHDHTKCVISHLDIWTMDACVRFKEWHGMLVFPQSCSGFSTPMCSRQAVE